MRKYSRTETAKLVRKALSAAFPRTRFSVTSKSYSGGSSISVNWTDGPRWSDVNPILDVFEGASFDGMTDCKGYKPNSEFNGEPCEFQVDYVQGQRHESPTLLQIAAYRVHKETKLPLLEVRDGYLRDGEYQIPFTYFAKDDVIAHGVSQRVAGGEWYSQLVYQIARNTATEKAATVPPLPELVTPAFIAGKVQQLLKLTARRGVPGTL